MDLNELLEIGAKQRSELKPSRIRCCMAAGCMSSGAAELKKSLEAAAGDKADVVGVGCLGLCSRGPLVQVDPSGHLYDQVKPEDAFQVVAAATGGTAQLSQIDTNQPFFTHQVPVVLENSGKIDPEKIEEYIGAGGYLALHHALYDMTPPEVVEEITASGLRGRGGAGYPTGLKWATVAKTAAEKRYVVCNADEGDPGAFMDRSVLESDPHRVLEGMAIAAYAVGADQGYIYVRGEYPLAISRLQAAIKHARRLGLLGSQVFESSFDFRIDIRIGAGAFVCGEETALINSIEGKRGVPRPRPPYPAQSGLWGFPTLINNVETFANIAPIIGKGAEWFSGIGTEGSKGTKVFALAGKIRNTGLIEVPMGTPLRTIVEDMGGGAPEGEVIKAVQTGGPSGGCIPAEFLDTPVDYQSLAKLGSIMGSGGMIVMDSRDDMVDVARFFMEFCMEESCGKCIPCRAGTVQIHRILTKITQGRGTQTDLTVLRSLCDLVRNTSLCGLGQSAPNPVISTLKYFEKEYLSKIKPSNGSKPRQVRVANRQTPTGVSHGS